MNSVDVKIFSWKEIFRTIRDDELPKTASKEQKVEAAKRYVMMTMPKLLSFLNDPDNTIEVVEDPVLPKIWKKEQEVFGSESNHCPVMVYSSGGSMMFDGMMSELSNLLESITVSENVANVHPGIFSTFLGIIKARILLGVEKHLVLGQYDLLGVSGVNKEEIRVCKYNINASARASNQAYNNLLEYVIIHEEIHNWQATHYPLNDIRSSLLSDYKIEQLKDAMTAIEGHSEFFTNLFAKDIVNHYERRREKPGTITKAIYKAIGTSELHARYTDGERFIKALYDHGGVKLANKALEVSPTREEIKTPGMYIDRVKEV